MCRKRVFFLFSLYLFFFIKYTNAICRVFFLPPPLLSFVHVIAVRVQPYRYGAGIPNRHRVHFNRRTPVRSRGFFSFVSKSNHRTNSNCPPPPPILIRNRGVLSRTRACRAFIFLRFDGDGLSKSPPLSLLSKPRTLYNSANGSNGEIRNRPNLNGPATGFGNIMKRQHHLCILVLKNRSERRHKYNTSIPYVKMFS